MPYQSTKTYGHEVGLSCAFRQWKADSHCNKLHGYALAVRLIFGSDYLDERNWVVDFGGLKTVKSFLQDTFDHKLLVAEDDPEKDKFLDLEEVGLADVVLVKSVGCEAFAKLVYEYVDNWLDKSCLWPRVKLHSVEIKEHGANSALFFGDLS